MLRVTFFHLLTFCTDIEVLTQLPFT